MTAGPAGASQSDNLEVCFLQENFVRHWVEVQVQIDYFQVWIPPDKSRELLLRHGVPDTFKLELGQPGETVQTQHAVVSVVGGDFAGVEIPAGNNIVVSPLTDDIVSMRMADQIRSEHRELVVVVVVYFNRSDLI